MSFEVPKFNTGNVSMRNALNKIAEYARLHGINPGGRPGWNQTADGWMPPLFRTTALESEVTWTLNIEDATAGEVSVDCGTIIKDASDLTTGISITNGTATFTMSGNQWLYLRTTSLSTPVVTLTSGGNWTDFPAAYEVTSSGATASYAAYYYPLYHFRATTATGYTRINDTLFYRKLCPDYHLELIHSIYQNGTDQPLVVHKFIPSHRVLPT